MFVDFRLSRATLLEGLQRESDETIRSVIVDMEQWLESVKSSTLLLGRVIQQREYSEPGLQQILRDSVEVNPDIFGATIALAPGQASSTLGFAPYYFRREGALQYTDLAGSDNNYQQQPWFHEVRAAGEPIWVEPYYDRAGGRVLMTTFAVPVYRTDEQGDSFLYAVVTADVALRELHENLQRLSLGRYGFGFLLSRSGIILSGRNPANIMRHYADAIDDPADKIAWQQMISSALNGEPINQHLRCLGRAGKCVLRLGLLQSTGWPVGVMYSEDEMTAPLRNFQLKTALIGASTLLMMAIAVIIVSRRLTRPLGALAAASDRIAQGDLDAPLPDAAGKDEVAQLVHSFSAMKTDLKTYIGDLEQATARRSRLEGELDAAKSIQMAMLPAPGLAMQSGETYQVWARVAPALAVGGDLYYYLERDGVLFLAVGDVSDKGVPAALFMARAISLIQQLAATSVNLPLAMATLNNALAKGNDNCMFVTLFLGMLDLGNLELRFASAGHTPPSLIRGGSAQSISQQQGPAMGLAPDLEFPVNTLTLRTGDRLAVFTDGINEAFNEANDMFGIPRCNQVLGASHTNTVAAAGDLLFNELTGFAGTRPQSDDICLLLLDIAASETIRSHHAFSLGPRLSARVEQWLNTILEPLPLAHDDRSNLLLVTEELVTNVEKYAGLQTPDSVVVRVRVNASQVDIEVRDAGEAFNPLVQSDRAELGARIEDAEVGGLGVHLITALTDAQTYRREDGWNILRVTKLLSKFPQ